MTTVQTIIDRAFAKSAAARIDISASPNELIARVNQCVLEVFQVLSRENPLVLATTASVAAGAGKWQRPSNCLRVLDVVADGGTVATPTLPPGTEILVVPYGDLALASGQAAVYELGQAFWPTGQAVDPSGGSLSLTYARAPVPCNATGDSVDPLFPDPYIDLLQVDLAAYLARKDERDADETAFNAQKAALFVLVIEWARAQTYSLTQRFPVISPPLTNSDGGRQAPGASS